MNLKSTLLFAPVVLGGFLETAEAVIAVQDHAMFEGSFMDAVYGPLVNTPEVLETKREMVREGQLSLPVEEDEIERWGAHHSSFYKASSKALTGQSVKFPADDDTSDLNHMSLIGGLVTYGHFPAVDCFNPENYESLKFDIAFLGAPFDTGTSYRPGARFGPNGLRQASRRSGSGLTPVRGSSKRSKLRRTDPWSSGLQIVDCGDVPMTPFDNRVALNQLYRGQRALHSHSASNSTHHTKPRVVSLGGDHTITLMALRSAYETYGPLSVVHFDSHIDTWDPKVLGGAVSHYAGVNHGTFLHYAAEAGYVNKSSSMHAGIRAPYIAETDPQHDEDCGFTMITARDMDYLGPLGIAARIKERVGTNPVYITLDIDVLDPAYAPGTGTAEVGGWTTRELVTVLDALEGIHLVGADVVEVSPPFDTNTELTSLAAVQMIDSFLSLMVVSD
ncbi:unnamed protein product [Kuraishia capsulata CBS 1993]|uniref:Agmatinase n=1 Tax=Kuraishia capsulata CBS 1993 TaxID=1382522 RepID=W6MJZ5_9ASCO|nr:uncharacterized protein KUCA_T00002284001 [Kuraishia capsulata CBS 1993]CDK26313.1 unnamed protein product [Kuraishia capsulata CBS 1993]